jgi:tetratricopeptide (TPR) repeat protein
MTLPYIRLIGLYNDGYEIDDIGRLFRDYLQLEARDRRLRGQYIRYLFQEGAYPSVLEQIDLLLPDTEHPVYYTRLKALTYRHMGDYAAATALYWRLLTEEPEHQGYLRALTYCLNKEGKRSTAIALLEKASSYLKEVDAELHLIHGVLLFQERDWERSLAAFREAASQRPGDWRPYYNIGEIYRRRGMRDFARRFLERAERLKAESEGDNR